MKLMIHLLSGHHLKWFLFLTWCPFLHGVNFSQDKVEIVEFLNEPFQEKLTVSYLLDELPRRRIKIIKEPVSNIYYPDQVDTIYHVFYKRSEFHVYRAREKNILYEALVKNRGIVKFRKGIHIEMNRKEFIDIFPGIVLNKKKQLHVYDGENSASGCFSFNFWGRLKSFRLSYQYF